MLQVAACGRRSGLSRISIAAVLTVSSAVLAGSLSADDDTEFFEKRVRPILVERCESCHSSTRKKSSGGLSLDTREGWQKGGDSGSPIVPGKPHESLLIRAVRYVEDGPQMPPPDQGGRLSEAEVAILVEWVQRGAPDPRIAASRIGGMTADEARQWWSLQPVRQVTPPAVRMMSWPQNEIDHFVLAEQEPRGFTPAPPADRRTLLRRASFDLTGLPPTPEEFDAFLSDTAPDAFATVVDRLLSSTAYGQRWARHWLDVVRYADYYDANPATRTPSCEITEAWRYRDWVVDSLNNDLPFDRFVVHQIAGDLLPAPDGAEVYPDGLIATTFLSNGVWDRGDADKEKIVSDMADDNIDTIGKAFLGLTLGCARCHDHKFDPVTNEDYYSLAGIFYSSHFIADLGARGGEYTMLRVPLVPKAVAEKRETQVRELNEVTARIAELDKSTPPTAADDPQRLALVADRDRRQAEMLPEPPLAMAVQEGGTPGGLFPGIQDVPVHIRGSYTKLGPIVPRRLPRIFSDTARNPVVEGSGRRMLADWVAAADNPLTARVIVNRLWQWHFGEGLVRTPGNFGKLGELPTHPDLLDWLAWTLIRDGWSLKKIHRRIMLSATYQQGGRTSGAAAADDPENRWLTRFAPRRLEAEAIRDAMMFVSGRLDLAAGGPAGDDHNIPRRSLYVQTARWDRSGYATLFDAANPDSSTDRRVVSTVAPQALMLLNHEFVLGQAEHLAARILRDGPADDVDRVRYAFQLLFGRPATLEDLSVAHEILGPVGTQATWTDLAHVLLCCNEFVYMD